MDIIAKRRKELEEKVNVLLVLMCIYLKKLI